MQQTKTNQPSAGQSLPDNTGKQGVDKDPAQERGKKEQVTEKDLKGKKVDADLSREEDQPLENEQ
jgi:hypothetical protein